MIKIVRYNIQGRYGGEWTLQDADHLTQEQILTMINKKYNTDTAEIIGMEEADKPGWP